MTYKLAKEGYDGEVKLDLNEGFKFTPHISSPLEIDSIIIYDPSLTSWFIHNRFLKKYRKLLTLVMNILHDEDADAGDIRIALDEVVHQKEIMAIKYNKYLKEKAKIEYQEQLDLLEKELKNKFLIMEYVRHAGYDPSNYVEEEKKGKGR